MTGSGGRAISPGDTTSSPPNSPSSIVQLTIAIGVSEALKDENRWNMSSIEALVMKDRQA
jgi:hypothetical protein